MCKNAQGFDYRAPFAALFSGLCLPLEADREEEAATTTEAGGLFGSMFDEYKDYSAP